MTRANRASVGLILMSLVTSGCSDLVGGPSEREMAQALQIDKPFSAFSQPYIFAIVAKQLGGVSIFLALSEIKITRVKKTECTKAVGKPGYVCAFAVSISVVGEGKKEKPESLETNCEARFVKTEDGWAVAADLN